MMENVLESARRLHLMGIGGTGLAPLALVLQGRGFQVSGCDREASPTLDRLARQGIATHIGHAPAHLTDADCLIVSSAIPADHPEVAAARASGRPVLKRPLVLGWLTRQYRTLAVAGTHGKTTTTALLTLALAAAGLDPTAIIGGIVPALGGGARLGRGAHLVLEADEFDRTFLALHPWAALVTNLEADHLDCYGSLAAIEQAFQAFLQRVPPTGLAVICADDPRLRRCAQGLAAPVVGYGLASTAEWQAVDLARNQRGGYDFTATHAGRPVARVSLALPGRHNVLNALGALALASAVGVPPATAAAAWADFTGVARRFEFRGAARGIAVYDDYAHHPTEIRATLAAARERSQGRVWCVFQPHTYGRTQALFAEFATAFALADGVIIVPIYSPAGREQPLPGCSAADLAAAIRQPVARYAPDWPTAVAQVRAWARPGDLVLTLGAGTITHLAPQILQALEASDDATG